MKFSSPFLAKHGKKNETWVLAVIYSILIYTLIIASHPKLQDVPKSLRNSFLYGQNNDLLSFDHAYDVFRPYLPQEGRISFVMDVDFNIYGTDIEQIYTAQSNFAPLIVNPEPIEPIAVINCSNDSAAFVRMKLLGYEPLEHISKGHFIARKRS